MGLAIMIVGIAALLLVAAVYVVRVLAKEDVGGEEDE